MKNTTNILLILAVLVAFVSCNDDDDNDVKKPQVENLEVGHNDTLHAGKPIHLEFNVTAGSAKLSHYTVKIHPEGEHAHKRMTLKSVEEHQEWEIDTTFREIAGLRNYTVHHHTLKVDKDAEQGAYHFDLVVFDEDGNTSTYDKDVTISHEEADHEEVHHHRK